MSIMFLVFFPLLFSLLLLLRCRLIFSGISTRGVGASSSSSSLVLHWLGWLPWPPGRETCLPLVFVILSSFFLCFFFFFCFNKLPLNKLENTHPGVIRRPQTLVICLPALPGKREQGREGEEERRTARISSSSSSFSSLAWYSVRGEREEELGEQACFRPARQPKAICHVLKKKKKKSPYIHIYLMRRENT